MKQEEYTTRVIVPEDGHTLTQAQDVKIEDRILSKKIYLAVTDSPSNWKEITDQEADEIRKQQEELINNEISNEINR